MTIKLITFDLDNTLWHTDPVIIRAEKILWAWIQTHCPAASKRFDPKSLQALKVKVAQNKPELRHKLSQLRLEFLYQVFIACDLSDVQARLLAEQAFSEFLQARNQITLFPGALDLLQALQADYQVIALSNGNSDLKIIGLDHLFKAHFHAENVAQPKPHADMFRAALEFSGIEAGDSLHIGDHPEQDVYAAQQLGFNTVWANILDHQWPISLSLADYEITQLNQLLPILKQLNLKA
jgi:putative hydrolase of the HAD superfamily